MKKARMNISHSRFSLFKLKIFGEIVTTYRKSTINKTNGILTTALVHVRLPSLT